MKKFFSILISTSFLLPAILFAESIEPINSNQDLSGFLNIIKNYLLTAAGSIAVLFIVIGGVKYVTSGGNTQRVDSAKKTITYAVIGLILIILADVIRGLFTSNNFLNIFR